MNLLPVDITSIQYNEAVPLPPPALHPEQLGNGNLLPIAAQVEPPLTRRPRGRPRKARLQVGEAIQRQQNNNLCPPPHCSTCGAIGHNSATCRNAHS